MSEIWRPIKDHPDYEVSNRGNVRTWPEGEPVKTQTTSSTELVMLQDTLLEVAYLVAETYLFKPGERFKVKHLDENPRNNHCTNLAWYMPGAKPKRSIKRRKRLPLAQIKEIRERYQNGEKQVSLAREFKTSAQNIHYIVKKKSFKKLK